MQHIALMAWLAIVASCQKTSPSTAPHQTSPSTAKSLELRSESGLQVFDDIELPSLPPTVNGTAGVGSPAPSGNTSLPSPPPPNTSAAPSQNEPKLDGNYPFPNIPSETFKLQNGLKVVLLPENRSAHVHFHIAYSVGRRDEPLGQKGISLLVEYLMFRGSAHAQNPIIQYLLRAGVDLNNDSAGSYINEDRSTYWTSLPANAFEYLLWLESDRMGYLREKIDQKAIDQAVSEIIAQDERQSDFTDRYLGLLSRSLYPDHHPYAGANAKNDLKKIQAEDVKSFLSHWYTPDNAVMTITGQFSADKAKELLQKYFATIASGPARSRASSLPPTLTKPVTLTHWNVADLPSVSLTWHSPALFQDDEPAMTLAALTLGSGPLSRLYRKLVIEQKLATAVYAKQNSKELSGTFTLEAATPYEENLDALRQAIIDAVSELTKEGPTSAELESAKALFELSLIQELETLSGKQSRSNRFSLYASHGDRVNLAFDLTRHMTVTSKDIAASAYRWLLSKPHITNYHHKVQAPIASDRLDRSIEPNLAGELLLNHPGFVSKTLPNGMMLHVISQAGLPKIEAALIIRQGDLSENKENAGLSYLTTSILEQGTKTRSRSDIEVQLALLGAELSSEGSKFGSALTLRVLKRNLDAATELLSDIALNPSFPEDKLTFLKESLIGQLNTESTIAEKTASSLMRKILYASGHPVGVADRGSKESITNLKTSDLTAHHEKFWVPSNVSWLVVGDITLEEAEKLALKHFSHWKTDAQFIPPPTPSGSSPNFSYVFLIDTQDRGGKSSIHLGATIPGRFMAAQTEVDLIQALLNGEGRGRLKQQLSKAGLEKDPAYAQIIQTPLAGFWQISAQSSAPQTATAVKALHQTLEELTRTEESFSEMEFQEAKKIATKPHLAKAETLTYLLQESAPLIVSNKDSKDIMANLRRIMEISADDVKKAAQEYFSPKRAITLVLGDLKEIERPIAALGLGETFVLSVDGQVIRKVEETPTEDLSTPSASPSEKKNSDPSSAIIPPGPMIDSSIPVDSPVVNKPADN